MWEAIRSLIAWVPLLIRAQLALMTAEVAAELRRLVSSILWMVILGIFGTLSVLMIAVTIVVTLWDQRVLAAGLTSVLFASVAAVAAWCLRRRRRDSERFISAC